MSLHFGFEKVVLHEAAGAVSCGRHVMLGHGQNTMRLMQTHSNTMMRWSLLLILFSGPEFAYAGGVV